MTPEQIASVRKLVGHRESHFDDVLSELKNSNNDFIRLISYVDLCSMLLNELEEAYIDLKVAEDANAIIEKSEKNFQELYAAEMVKYADESYPEAQLKQALNSLEATRAEVARLEQERESVRQRTLEDALIAIDDTHLYESRGQERYIKSLIRKLMEKTNG